MRIVYSTFGREPKENEMRIMIDFQFPVARFNALVKDGSAGAKISQALESIRPQAVYFGEREGLRGGTMIVDLDDPSKMPAIAEPLFLLFDARVSFHPVMTPEDLKKAGLEALGKKYA
jgi:hypothetical protein